MNMKVNFGPKFDWFDVIDRLIAGETPSAEDENKIRERAGPWTTCACGQLCQLLPRDSSKSPKDELLRALGGAFAQQMSSRRWREAKTTLIKIEKRTSKLLTDMGIPVTFGGTPKTFRLAPAKPVEKPVQQLVKPSVVTHAIAERFVFRGGH
jgi:hypothetical protein